MSTRKSDLAVANEQSGASEASLKERLEFETLLAKLSARFVNLPADQIGSEIGDAQRRVCKLLNIDRSTLWQVMVEAPGTLLLTNIHQPQGIPTPPQMMDAGDFFPWATRKILGGETLTISKLSDLPPEADRDLESFHYFGTKSTVLVPLSVGGGPVFGLLGFAVVSEERTWPVTVVRGFRLVAQVFANALARVQAEQALKESETRLTLATAAAGAGLWMLEPATGTVWISDIARELFCMAPEEAVTYERFLSAIRADERKGFEEALCRALQAGEKFVCECPIVIPAGGTRWLLSHGQRQRRQGGDAHCVTGVSLDITERREMENQLQERLREVEELKQRLERENIYLQEDRGLLVDQSDIVGRSAALKEVLDQAERVARTDSTVLLLGETGTGKELLARLIHRMSRRKDRALVTVSCASLPPTLVENELLGREKGAYTGALTRMVGRFEMADGSSLFLDEIGELPLEVQSKLLRILEEGRFERLGSTKTLRADVRIIAATNRNLDQAVEEGTFRKDLYYRLKVFPIVVPPLRDRPEDIPLLIWTFVRKFEKTMGKRIDKIHEATMEAMRRYTWPGNIRELKHVVEHGMIMTADRTLTVDLPHFASQKRTENADLKDTERKHVLSVLEETGWRIGGKGGAAEALGLRRTTLQSLMRRLGIERPRRQV